MEYLTVRVPDYFRRLSLQDLAMDGQRFNHSAGHVPPALDRAQPCREEQSSAASSFGNGNRSGLLRQTTTQPPTHVDNEHNRIRPGVRSSSASLETSVTPAYSSGGDLSRRDQADHFSSGRQSSVMDRDSGRTDTAITLPSFKEVSCRSPQFI